MQPTLNDISLQTRAQMVALLQARVSDLRDLYLASKTAHWNVRGPSFAELHKRFDRVADTALELVDSLAELARSLGGAVDAQAITGSRRMPVLEGDSCAQYVALLAEEISVVLKSTREDAGRAMDVDDLVTSDALIKAAGTLQRELYLTESFIALAIAMPAAPAAPAVTVLASATPTGGAI